MKRKDSKGRVLPDGISQRPNGRYQGRVTVDGKQYTVTGNDLADVKEKFNELKVKISKGILGEDEERNSSKEITMDEWWEVYLQRYKEGILKELVLRNYRRYWKWYVSPIIGGKKLNKITRTDLVNLVKKYEERDRPLAHSTIIYVHGLINGCLQKAYLENRINRNPCYEVLSTLKNRKSKGKTILTVEQKENFMKYVEDTPFARVYINLFELLFQTGIRIGECLALTWNDIFFDENYIQINKTLHYSNLKKEQEVADTKFFITEPKTITAYREIPMNDKVREALLGQKEYQDTFKLRSNIIVNGYSNFVFTNNKCNLYNADFINAVIKRIVNNYNKEERKRSVTENRESVIIPIFSAHSTRHYYTSRCVEQEMMPKALQNILGHKKIETTLSIYTHLSKEIMQGEVNKVVI